MTYAKQTWNNGNGGATRLSSDRLNHMEDGIDSSDASLAAVAVTLATATESTGIAATKVTAANSTSALANSASSSKVRKTTITTKGDLHVGNGAGSVTRIAAGANGRILTSDPASANKMKYGIIVNVSATTPSGGATGDLYFKIPA